MRVMRIATSHLYEKKSNRMKTIKKVLLLSLFMKAVIRMNQ